MNSKLVAVGVGAFSYGALVAWAFTADHLDGKMKRNQLILGEMLSRQQKQIVDLESRLIDRAPWTSPSDDAVKAVADQVVGDILGMEEVEDGVEFTARIDDPRGAVVGTVESIVEPTPARVGAPPSDDEPVDEVAMEHTRRTLQSLIDNYTADPDDRDAFVAKASNVLEFANETPPFHISVDKYASDPEEGDGYAKITLTYYPAHRILIDDDEDVLTDVENYVGWRNLARFGDESGDPDTVFVRNRRLLTDFEVVREEDEEPPIHIRYGMDRETFKINKAAGIIKFRDEDSD